MTRAARRAGSSPTPTPAATASASWTGAETPSPLVWDPSGAGGHLGVAGAPRTGKTELLRTVVLGLAARRSPVEAQCYCIDLGGGGLAPLAGLPHVGAVAGAGEPEAAARVLHEVLALIDERAAARRSAGAPGTAPVDQGALPGAPEGGPPAARPGAPTWPRVFVVVDNVGALRQSLPELEEPLARIATSGLAQQVHLVVAANRWWDVRPQVVDALGTKLELRLGDPGETCTRREAARAVPVGVPGRGVTGDGAAFQAAMASMAEEPGAPDDHLALAAAVARVAGQSGGPRAPRVAPLPDRVDATGVAAAAAAAGSRPPDPAAGFLLGLGAHRSRPVQVDLLAPGAHLQVLGDADSGRSTLLGRVLDHLAGRPAGEVRVLLVDPVRAHLDRATTVDAYAVSATAATRHVGELAGELASRLPPDDADVGALLAAGDVAGPAHVVVVDDYDLLAGDLDGPLGGLVPLLGQAAWIGLHVVVARRVTGSQRSQFEPFLRRLRELRPATLVLPGSPEEGPVVDGVVARPGPAGRATLVQPGRPPTPVQCCVAEAGR